MPMFVRKRFGWGITPGDWRGWTLTGVYIAGVGALSALTHDTLRTAIIAVSTVSFIAFAIWAFVRKL